MSRIRLYEDELQRIEGELDKLAYDIDEVLEILSRQEDEIAMLRRTMILREMRRNLRRASESVSSARHDLISVDRESAAAGLALILAESRPVLSMSHFCQLLKDECDAYCLKQELKVMSEDQFCEVLHPLYRKHRETCCKQFQSRSDLFIWLHDREIIAVVRDKVFFCNWV